MRFFVEYLNGSFAKYLRKKKTRGNQWSIIIVENAHLCNVYSRKYQKNVSIDAKKLQHLDENQEVSV